MKHSGPYTVETTLRPNPRMHGPKTAWKVFDVCGAPHTLFDNVSEAVAVAQRYVLDGGSARVMGNTWDECSGWDTEAVWYGLQRPNGVHIVDLTTEGEQQ